MKVLLTSTPVEPSPGVRFVHGLEPWDIVDLAADFPKPAVPTAMIDSATILRQRGPAALNLDLRAAWHNYFVQTKPPLPAVEPTDVTAAVKNALKVISQPAENAKAELEEALERTAKSLVCRSGDIGLFAARGATRLTSLPDWVKGAVLVNTKDEYVEIIQVGHCPVLQLDIWCTAAVPGAWTGHRYRIRRRGLLTIQELHFAVTGLHAAVRHSR